MKRRQIFGILLAGTLALSAAGCGGDPKPAEHVHDWGEWQITEPTCETKGEKKRTCKTDPSHTEREDIPELGHKWSKEWTMEADGHYHTCENGCGSRKDEGEHVFKNGKCETCGYALTPSSLRYEEVSAEDGTAAYSVIGWEENVTDRTQLVIPAEHEGKPVISIGESAFDVDDGDGDETLASVYLPESVKDIGGYAFYGCSGLKSVNLENVENLYKGAFYECTALEKAEMGELETLGQYAFYGCTSLTYVRVEGIKTFEEQALRNCPALERVDFGDGVETLADYTFYESDGVRFLSFGKGYSQEVAVGTFPSGLESVEISAENPTYAAEGGVLYNKSKTELVCVPLSIKGRVAVAGGVTEIKAIKTHFMNHPYVTSITIPASVESVASGFISNAFKGCYALAEIYDLSPIEITVLDDFGLNEGTVIHTALSEKSVVTDPDENGFVWRTDANELHTYFGKETELTLPDGHNGANYSVHAYAFYMGGLTKVTVPSKVSALGERCFYGNAQLEEVKIEEGTEEIGTGVFNDCSALAKISLPKSLEKIGAGAFAFCDALERADFAGTVSEWAAIEFGNRYSNIFITSSGEKLATLYLGDGAPLPEKIVIEGIEEIGSSAFYGAPVKEVVIGKGVKKIGQEAFSYCADLKTVVLGSDLERFDWAFRNVSIEKVYYEGTEETWQTLNGGVGGGSALSSNAEIYFFADAAPESGKAWHYGSNGEIEEW